jgi:fumarate reductase subunit D
MGADAMNLTPARFAEQKLKRSNAPIFWLLFGAGGMLSALIGPMLVFITGIAVPLGLLLPADAMSYSHMQVLVQSFPGKGFLFTVIALFMWHAAHRLFHSVHDLGFRTGTPAWTACYGSALAATLASLYLLVLT